MKNLKADVLSKEEIEMIHEGSLEVLSQTGIRVAHTGARAIMERAGCTVDESSGIVRIPRDVINGALKSVPRMWTFSSRDGKHDVKMVSDGSRTNFMNLGMGTKVCHYVSENRFDTRDSTIPDIRDIAKVLDACENVDLVTQPVSALDLMNKRCVRTLHEVEAMITNTSKPFLLDPDPNYVDAYFDIMKACYSGDGEEARKKPFLMVGGCSSSPLQLDTSFCELAIKAGEYGMPFMSMTMAMAGTTSPVTLAGTMAIHNSEALAGITLAQLVKPGLPVIYGSCTTGFDFMTDTAPFGSPENALISSASSQMSQFYGVPCITSGAISDSKCPDFQSAQEATLNAMLPALNGTSNVFGVGLIELGMTFSLEQAVMVNDMIPLVRRALEGFEVNSETLSIDAIKEVGVGGEFISRPETMAGMFGHTHPELFDRNMYDGWKSTGGRHTVELAHEKVRSILEEHVATPIDADDMKTIQNIIKEADKKVL
ncbi:MAG: trimethylamine methyltransferase family protein [Methanomassiliicoccaceae archaeon]|nr:trimethylamine methyltransferase family protein [Methanomassiliicoccaceae archaeon]